MANFTQSVAYGDGTAAAWNGAPVSTPHENVSKGFFDKFKSKRLSQEDIEVVAALEAVKSDMEFLHNCFDHTTDAILIDSLIYELKAANLKYQYYINLCKEKGIICAGLPELKE